MVFYSERNQAKKRLSWVYQVKTNLTFRGSCNNIGWKNIVIIYYIPSYLQFLFQPFSLQSE